MSQKYVHMMYAQISGKEVNKKVKKYQQNLGQLQTAKSFLSRNKLLKRLQLTVYIYVLHIWKCHAPAPSEQ